MNLNHLSDNELISYIIKYDDDPVRVRLATYMERIAGALIDDLEYAGMDPTYCTFTTEWGSDRLPGQYITHLEEEVDIRDREIRDLVEELDKMKLRSIVEVMDEFRNEIARLDRTVRAANEDMRRLEIQRNDALNQLNMWTTLNA
jgi:t-SNARE complex subunit (syntaxin)